MGLKIRSHSGEPRFTSINYFGKPIFDLTVAAKIGHNTRPFRCVKEIQDKAEEAGLAVQVLPLDQAHITVLNPIFRMEGKGIVPQKHEQTELFNEFKNALAQFSWSSELLLPLTLNFNEIFVRQRDVKLMALRSDELDAVQLDLQNKINNLKDRRFDFSEGLPHIDGRFFTTILRFKEGFSHQNYDKLMEILYETSFKFRDKPLNMRITLNCIKAVQFNSLFEPWVKERF
jgi:hypothetical protein